MRELIPGEDDQSVHEIFDLLTQNGNGGEQQILLYHMIRLIMLSMYLERSSNE